MKVTMEEKVWGVDSWMVPLEEIMEHAYSATFASDRCLPSASSVETRATTPLRKTATGATRILTTFTTGTMKAVITTSMAMIMALERELLLQ